MEITEFTDGPYRILVHTPTQPAAEKTGVHS